MIGDALDDERVELLHRMEERRLSLAPGRIPGLLDLPVGRHQWCATWLGGRLPALGFDDSRHAGHRNLPRVPAARQTSVTQPPPSLGSAIGRCARERGHHRNRIVCAASPPATGRHGCTSASCSGGRPQAIVFFVSGEPGTLGSWLHAKGYTRRGVQTNGSRADVAVDKLILRFRDLVTDPSETIASHRAIIDAEEYVWWAWWHKLGEKVPTEVFTELNRRMNSSPMQIYLMDSGQELLYEATCAEIRWANDLEREPSPEPDKTPDYYKNRPYQAWFKLTHIAADPVTDPEAVLNALTYERVDAFFKSGASQYVAFYGKRIYSLPELRQQDRTIWFVRPAQAADPHHEIALVNARTTMPRDFVTEPIAAPSRTFLWLSDVHLDSSGAHHTFALEPVHGGRMLRSALEEDVKSAGVTQLGGIIVSGDLTWRASVDDYEHVKAMMRNIQSWSRLADPAYFIVCPGNHDLAFSEDPASKDRPVTVAPPEARAPYEQFYSGFFQRGPNEFLAMGRRYLIENSRIVDIVALNTSLLEQHAGIFQGQGFVGDAQLGYVATQMGWKPENVESRAYRVLVLHHHVMPIVHTEVPERGRQYSLLLDAGAVLRWAVRYRVDLILHGHMHQPYCGLITLPIQSTGELTNTHTIGLAALASTGVGPDHRGDIGQNLFGLLDFEPDGVRIRMYPISRTTPLNPANNPFLESKVLRGATP